MERAHFVFVDGVLMECGTAVCTNIDRDSWLEFSGNKWLGRRDEPLRYTQWLLLLTWLMDKWLWIPNSTVILCFFPGRSARFCNSGFLLCWYSDTDLHNFFFRILDNSGCSKFSNMLKHITTTERKSGCVDRPYMNGFITRGFGMCASWKAHCLMAGAKACSETSENYSFHAWLLDTPRT